MSGRDYVSRRYERGVRVFEEGGESMSVLKTDITIVWGGINRSMRVTLNDRGGSVRVISNPEDTFVGAPVVVRYAPRGKMCEVIPVSVIHTMLEFLDNI